MYKKHKKFLTLIFTLTAVFSLFFLLNTNKSIAENSDILTSDDNAIISISNDEINQIVNRHQNNSKPLEEITFMDILRNEKVSPELKQRIIGLLDKVQYETDKYRTTIANHYKQVETKLIDFKNEINGLHTFKDTMESNLNISKWMIISLSIGIFCLTIIVIVMWRSVVNVNRNDVELIYSIERFRKDLKLMDKRIEMIETLLKRDGQQISNN